MSAIAERAGIGRATLYKYFGDIEAILHAWHARQITSHLQQLEQARDRAADPRERLEAVLNTYALIAHRTSGRHDMELVAFLHRDEQVDRARQHLHALVRDLIADGARARQIRDDVDPDALAAYCLHALSAAGGLPTEAAVGQLVQVTMAGLRCV